MAALAAARSRLGPVGLILAAIVVALALVGPFIAPYAPEAFIGAPFQKSNGAMLLGADVLGRDGTKCSVEPNPGNSVRD